MGEGGVSSAESCTLAGDDTLDSIPKSLRLKVGVEPEAAGNHATARSGMRSSCGSWWGESQTKGSSFMRAFKSLRIVGWLTAALFVAIGIVEATYANGTRARQTLFFVALTLFAVLIVAGIRLFDRRPWLGAGLASVGAVLGGISLFWTVGALLLAIAIVWLSVVCARKVSAQSA